MCFGADDACRLIESKFRACLWQQTAFTGSGDSTRQSYEWCHKLMIYGVEPPNVECSYKHHRCIKTEGFTAWNHTHVYIHTHCIAVWLRWCTYSNLCVTWFVHNIYRLTVCLKGAHRHQSHTAFDCLQKGDAVPAPTRMCSCNRSLKVDLAWDTSFVACKAGPGSISRVFCWVDMYIHTWSSCFTFSIQIIMNIDCFKL